eukprot:5094886-Prymnesium_polylepis.1
MATSIVWMQEVSPVAQQDVQERRIKRYLRHDIAIEMGNEAADAMYYLFFGRGYQCHLECGLVEDTNGQ